MNTAEFSELIDYYLSQLGSRNEHHRFERLCTEIARLRIATNLLVATGPVSAGGDGGRDAESFESTLPHEVSTWFSIRATTAAVAIACSIEKDYTKKIRNDVAKITASSDRRFDRIIFFSSQPIPSGKRIALSKELSLSGCTLAIWDRAAISHALAEPDLHWVAHHYLDIPAELVESIQPSEDPEGFALDEVYYVPGQALVNVIHSALAMPKKNSHTIPAELVELQHQYVSLHLALDMLLLTRQHAYELSRKSDEAAKKLRDARSSGAEALREMGLLS
ncbi:hypothetical protein OG824_20530 [Streptomyces prunicolor]|uniref:hypothetical protein n=1 Tax=Streptomyces prunicolor TaxID=67348 RepID=UPI00224D6B01|nr:hypothetical protein [Streptomyces prunicolor]MCX5237592.1 hypothetical protein [Streptomyces prunicolor]